MTLARCARGREPSGSDVPNHGRSISRRCETGTSLATVMHDPRAARLLLLSRRLVVLDFDGPLTRLLPGEEYLRVTAGARELAFSLGIEPDDELARQTDHVQLLRLLDGRRPAVGRVVEQWCTEQEVAAATVARPVPTAGAFVRSCRARGADLAVVTNNAPSAVAAVLAHGGPDLASLPVHGRDPRRADLLKPSPHMLLSAAREARVVPSQAVMIGDSASDVLAATAATMACIGLSPDPGRRAELLRAGAEAVAADLAALLGDRS